ncbi:MAG: gephyrin-like molybdotransferase Glp [Thermodesulfobacteriota bacterium]
MSKPFLRVLSPLEARNLLAQFTPLNKEAAGIDDALFRVVAEPVIAWEDTPGFDRSTMDGFAVRSAATFGASESSPALFEVVGEIMMGQIHDLSLGPGKAARIWTGGALPANADAVVMVEHTHELDDRTIEISRAVAPFENVVRRGEDFKAGEVLLDAGHRLRSQDLGLLAAMGRARVTVFRKPSVAILSSGDEIVPIEQDPPPGCMRDVNRHTITASVLEAHAIPVWVGIAADRLAELAALLDRGLSAADMVVISGGSSMGSRDFVIEAIESYPDSEILLHGVSVSPGKPLILARVGDKPVMGLPGHPASAMVCFEQFAVPIIRRLSGEDVTTPYLRPATFAFLSRNIPSREGRLDFVRVRLDYSNGRLTAIPVPGKSGMISAMVRAHGYICIAQDCEGLYKGDRVKVHLFSNWGEDYLETEYLSGHEGPGGGSDDLLGASAQEKLSRV